MNRRDCMGVPLAVDHYMRLNTAARLLDALGAPPVERRAEYVDLGFPPKRPSKTTKRRRKRAKKRADVRRQATISGPSYAAPVERSTSPERLASPFSRFVPPPYYGRQWKRCSCGNRVPQPLVRCVKCGCYLAVAS